MSRYVRPIRMLLPAVVIAGTFAWAPPAAAQTIAVTTTAPSPGAASDCTLGEAIQAANTDTAVDACPAGLGDDVISLPVGTYTQASVDHTSPDGAVALPEITSTITIDGANPTTTIIQRSTAPETPSLILFRMAVSTNDQCWPNCTLTLKDITLANAKGIGGAVTNLAGRTVVDNATVAGNTEGPAFRTTGRLTVRNSSVTNNSSAGQGGVFKADGDATVSGTTFQFNSGSSGGVLHFGASSNVTVTNSTFDSNSAGTGGVFSGSGTLDITGSTFTNNTATAGGGAIGGIGGTVRVTSSTFETNGAVAGSAGGAIDSDAALSVTSSTFEDNTSEIGGAISAEGASTTIKNSTFSANGANLRGGGVALSGGTATIANSTFAENFGTEGGGFSWLQGTGSLSLRNTLVANNSGTTGLDCFTDAPLASQGYNLVRDATSCGITAGTGDQLGTNVAPIDPLLGTLDTTGGTTKTYSLLVGSPAIDAGNPAAPGSGGSACEQFDQRGQARPRDGNDDDIFLCDIGSYEGGTGLPLLTVQKDGTGTGLVDTVADATIDCGSDCAETYTAGTSVTLLATPTTDAVFTGWNGCTTVVGDQCTVSMDVDKTVTATFTDVQSILSVTRTGAGQGSVTSSPEGVDCGLDCSELYSNGTTITLTAAPAGDSNFHFWSGCDQTDGTTCTVTMNEDRSVFASFSPIVEPLTVNKAGGGTGTVTSDPEGIDCGSDCGESYQIFSEVTLTAEVGPNSEFGGWSGCTSAVGLTCTVTMNDDVGVTATFTAVQRELTVTKVGSSLGTITSSPPGIDCPDDCSQQFDDGTTVTLTGNPDLNVDFTGWTGCDSVNANVCTVQMDAAENVTGSFAPSVRTLNVTKQGAGTGTVTSAPAGVDCGLDCTQDYDHGTLVTLTAAPGANSVVAGWTGCDSTTATTCTVVMNGGENVVATFGLEQRTLTVSKQGSGAGTVSSSPVGIDCGSDCTQDFDHGTSVTLTPTAGANSVFAGWTGCDSVSGNDCIVAMAAAKNVTATFGLQQRTLTVVAAGAGSGAVSSSPAGIDCGVDCTQDFDHGTPVTLTAIPGPNSQLNSWSGCTATQDNECTVTMDAAKNVTATFGLQQRTLTVSKQGAITGTVTGVPAGIDCGSDCTQDYDHGTSVTLTVDAGPNAVFAGWTDCDTPVGNDCTMAMTAARTVTATFTPAQRNLTVVTDGSGSGTVASAPAGIDCGGDCTHDYDHGTSVTLSATPAAGSAFDSWTDCPSPVGTNCTVALTAARTVTATFTTAPQNLSVSKSGTGGGSVASSPVGLDCGLTCDSTFAAGSTVTLTPAPNASSTFDGWTGCDSLSGNDCIVIMDSATSVNVEFSLIQRSLTVQPRRVDGDSAAAGTVTSNVGGITCAVGSDCAQDFGHGSVVVLTASPAANNNFAGWTDCDNASGNVCTMTMDAAKTVTARFHNTTVPSSSVTVPNGPTIAATQSFVYAVDPGPGLAVTVVELWVDGPSAGGFVKVAEKNGAAQEGTFTGYALSDGNGTYRVMTRSRNNAGNYEPVDATPPSFVLDTQAPSSTVTASTSHNVNTFPLQWSANDSADLTGVEAVQLWVDGPGTGPAQLVATDAGGASGGFTFTANQGAGAYSFYSIAEDWVGNREAAPSSPDVVVNVALCAGFETDPRVHLVGTAGNDKLNGTSASEVICGLGGNDTMRGGGGADLFVGSTGKDTVTYSERKAKQAVIVTVNKGANDGQKNEGDHVASGIEIVIGGAGADVLTGSGAKETLKGGLGNDNLKGGGGNDKLYGEKGRDKLNGGPKKDVCKTGETYKACEVM